MNNKNPSGIVRVLGLAPVPPPPMEVVAFHGALLEAIRVGDVVWVSVRRMCEAIGIAFQAQHLKLSDPEKSPWAVVTQKVMTGPDGKNYETFCLDLECVPMWLAKIESSRVSEAIRPKLVLFQKECVKVLRDHFFKKAALQIAVPKTLAEALRLAADLEDERSALAAEVKELAPKAEFHDRVAVSDGLALIGDVGRALGYGRNTFFDMLREKDIIMQRPSTAAFQNHIDAGRFVVVTSVTTDRKGKTHVHFTSKVTGKGFVWLAKLFGKPGVEYEFPEEKVAS